MLSYMAAWPLASVFPVSWCRDIGGDIDAPGAVLEGIAGRISKDAAGKLLKQTLYILYI